MESGNQLPAIMESIQPKDLGQLLQECGYRAEVISDDRGQPQVRSATSGISFFARFGNPAKEEGAYQDFSLFSLIRVDGDYPLTVINDWNAERRFARLHRNQNFMVLQMDVSVVGGVSPKHVTVHLQLWDRLIQEWLRYLREALANAGLAATQSQPPAAVQ